MKYAVIVKQAPDGNYLASCLVIPEAKAHGKTHTECMDSIKEAIELCLKYRKEHSEEIPREDQTEIVTVSL